MVRPRSLRCRLGCVATGFTMDGILFCHLFPGRSEFRFQAQLSKNAIDDVARAQWESAVDQDGTELVFCDVGLKRQERTELRIAVLFDYKAELMFGEERFHGGVKGESAEAHKVANHSAFGKKVERFANGRIAAAQR